MTKLLGFVETYKQRELCDSICGRADAKTPVVVAGDLSGDQLNRMIAFYNI